MTRTDCVRCIITVGIKLLVRVSPYCRRYDDHVHDPIEWKAEDRAVAGDTDEETRCSASHDRGHRTVLDSEHFSYL